MRSSAQGFAAWAHGLAASRRTHLVHVLAVVRATQSSASLVVAVARCSSSTIIRGHDDLAPRAGRERRPDRRRRDPRPSTVLEVALAIEQEDAVAPAAVRTAWLFF